MERELLMNDAFGDVERGEGALTFPLSNAGKIFVNVPVTVRCDGIVVVVVVVAVGNDDDDEFFFKSDEISKDELTVDVALVDADVDDVCNI